MNYVSMEYDPFHFPDDASKGTQTINKGLLQWFSSTLEKCTTGDIVLINGDFISMDSITKNLLQNKCQNGVNVIMVVDRWEISGYPLLSSKTGQDWSPDQTQNSGCISSGPCKNSTSSFNKYPYGCPDNAPGAGNGYCPDTNQILIELQKCSNFYVIDQAATKLNVVSGTSRNSPLHNHRHVTTFYMPSQGLGSVFKGSWNFTGGSPDQATSLPGQKESGFTVTASLKSDIIQNDIIWNYYWLTAMSVFSPASLSPPTTFTNPGADASKIFATLLGHINAKNIDSKNDQLLFNPYGSQTQLYSITPVNGDVYVSADIAVLSIGYGPPPGPVIGSGGLANPTPWEDGKQSSSMLTRTISDNGDSTQFNKIWPTLSCVSNTLEFLYPYTPVYSKNPVPAPAWRVPYQSVAPNCGKSSVENFVNIGSSCSSDTDCGTDAQCVDKFCVFKNDSVCSTKCDRCGLVKNRSKSQACNVPPGAPPGCYSVTKTGCTPDSQGNIKCSEECPCFTCNDTCGVVDGTTDLSHACFFQNADGEPVPSNGCFSLEGKKYSCAARVPWAPGGLWLGGLMYKFWKDASSSKDKDVYVSMYSSFDDAGNGCILNCPEGSTGGDSAWGSGTITSSQYNASGAGAIDSERWYSLSDSNSIQDVLDFLGKGGSVYLLRGQWAALSTGTDGAFGSFKNAAGKGGGSYNAKLYLAQQKQITATGGNNTVTTPVDKNKNPDRAVSQRNHTKCYISSNSIASSSGHPYNGGVQDWGGVNEVLLVEKCPNACKPIRRNWEEEWKYGEELKNAATFPWAKPWSNQDTAKIPTPTQLNPSVWTVGSKQGGLISLNATHKPLTQG